MSISSKLLLMMSTLVNQLTDQAVIPSSENFFLQKQSVTFQLRSTSVSSKLLTFTFLHCLNFCLLLLKIKV